MIRFELRTEYLELNKILKAVGVCPTGGAAGIVITEGRVRVDGQVETRKGCKVRPGQRIEFDGETIIVESAGQ